MVNLRPGLIGKLTSLQELRIMPCEVSVQFLKELGMLRELRVLHTWIDATNVDENMERALLESLCKLHNIQTVDIEGRPSLGMDRMRDAGLFSSCRQLRDLRLGCSVFSGLSVWIKSSLAPNLTHLYLRVQAVKKQDMETLGRLPELCFLELHTRNTILVNIEICTEGVVYFRKLKILRIYDSSTCFGLHGSECNSSSSIASIIMPSLESIMLDVHVKSLKAATLLSFDKLLGFENLGRTSLQRVTAEINCRRACPSDLKDAEKALHAAAVHPQRPILTLNYRNEASMDVSRTWKLADIVASGHIRKLPMSDPESSGKVIRLLYANAGTSLLALGSNGVHKLWKWQYSCGLNPHGTSTTSIPPQLWQLANGIVLKNDTSDFNPEEATACNALSKKGGYLISASGGKVSLFNFRTVEIMTTFMAPPPAATFLAFYPQDNNIIAIGMEDSSIQIYDVRIDDVKSKLIGHQKKITGLAFSQSMNVLVSSGADAQLCVWSIDSWEKKKSKYMQPPSNDSGSLDGDTMVQFHYDQPHLLIVHESQLAVYDGELEC